MTHTSQLVLDDPSRSPSAFLDLLWMVTSLAPIGAFAALVAGSLSWAAALTLVLVAMLVFDQRSA
jgi:hypothetical protein